MKVCPVGAELFHADGRTGGHVTRLVVAFRNFANTPEKVLIHVCQIAYKKLKV
jgi:hypothetical protein